MCSHSCNCIAHYPVSSHQGRPFESNISVRFRLKPANLFAQLTFVARHFRHSQYRDWTSLNAKHIARQCVLWTSRLHWYVQCPYLWRQLQYEPPIFPSVQRVLTRTLRATKKQIESLLSSTRWKVSLVQESKCTCRRCISCKNECYMSKKCLRLIYIDQQKKSPKTKSQALRCDMYSPPNFIFGKPLSSKTCGFQWSRNLERLEERDCSHIL